MTKNRQVCLSFCIRLNKASLSESPELGIWSVTCKTNELKLGYCHAANMGK